MTLEGRETVAVTLPHPYDPADWLAQHGIEGLHAFIRTGCLDTHPNDIRPSHAGRYLAERIAARDSELVETLTVLGTLGARLHDHAAQKGVRSAGRPRPRSRRAWSGRLVGACCFGKARRSPPTRSAYELISSDTRGITVTYARADGTIVKLSMVGGDDRGGGSHLGLEDRGLNREDAATSDSHFGRQPLLDTRAAAAYTGLGERYIRRLRSERRISCIRIGGRVLFDPDDLDRLIDRRRESAINGDERRW